MSKISYYGKASGTSFCQEALAKISPKKTPLRLVPEENEYDEFATRIEALLKDGWTKVGYIPKGKNQEINKFLKDGGEVAIECSDVTGGTDEHPTLGLNYGITYGDDSAIDPADMRDMECQDVVFGDDDYIFFDVKEHKAYDKDGHELLSGSRAEKQLRPEVDLTYPAKAMSKTTGVKSEDILALWDHNRDLSADFGTLVHAALEHYLRYAPVMRKIDENKEREHTAKNWMPDYLGDIVDKFIETSGLKEHPFVEARIKCGRRTGIVDCLLVNPEEGTFSIWDYKVTKELKEVKYTGLGKHMKYTVQQNFYREIIEDVTNYTCSEMLLWQWDGEKWSSHALEKVDLGEYA